MFSRVCRFLCATSLLVCAQETVHMASLAGRVTDPSGAVLAGAVAIARNTDTNVSSTAETDRDGRYRFPYLRIGTYEVRVRLDKFADAVRSVSLSAGSAYELPVTLTIATAGTTVDVSAETALVEANRSTIA